MLPKQYSFVLRQDRSFFQKARRSFSSHFTFFFQDVTSHTSQVIVLVSKKVSTKATTRNALKRMVYSTLEPLIEEQGKHLKVVVVPKASALHLQKTAMQAELSEWYHKQTMA